MPGFFALPTRAALAVGLLAGIAAPGSVQGAKFKVLHAFTGYKDGQSPQSTPLFDKKLGLLTTNSAGGLDADPHRDSKHCSKGCGTANATTLRGSETVVFRFDGGNGDDPSTLIKGGKDIFFGTTYGGGAGGRKGKGTAFMLTSDGTVTVLHTFVGGNDGANPSAGLVRDSAANLYGTTFGGGKGKGCSGGCGTVFKIAADGSETVLYAFTGGTDGASPLAPLIRDETGNLYGTVCCGLGYGNVFRLAPDGTETVLYAFKGSSDGAYPEAGLIEDAAGNFYGTTTEGGAHNYGTIFELAPDGSETVLHSFSSSPDGDYPLSTLIRDPAGVFYGTTEFGGGAEGGCGTIFKMTPDTTVTVLHAFNCKKDGANPVAGVAMDPAGNLYGTAENGGGNLRCGDGGCGTIFELKN